jgi:hypothetical protein
MKKQNIIAVIAAAAIVYGIVLNCAVEVMKRWMIDKKIPLPTEKDLQETINKMFS